MYTSIADFSKIPIILYNVPSRTGVNIEPSTYKALAEHKNIVAIKEANGNLSKIVETMSYVHEKLDLYSGNDDQIVPILSLGGKGVISVLSNVAPRQTHEICAAWFEGDPVRSLDLQLKALPLCHALFADVNPIPVKWAMNRLGWNAGPCRLPLVEPNETVRQRLETSMRDFGILD